MKKIFIQWVYCSSLIIAFEMAIAATASFLLGAYFGRMFDHHVLLGGMWSVISAVLVVQATNQEAFSAAWLRVVGSLIGAIAAGCLISFFGYHVWVFTFGIFLTVIICALCHLKETFRLACITMTIIMVIGAMSPNVNPWANCLARFVESFIGVVMGLVVALPLKPIRVYFREAYEGFSKQGVK